MSSSLRLYVAHNRTLLIESDGAINAPFSLYLNERFDNPHTREAVSTGLRLFHRFLIVYHIDLPARALTGECLLPVECIWLAELAYRPLEQIEQMSDAMLKRLTTVRREISAMDLKGAVEPNTAAKRLNTVADFLTWYLDTLLDHAIRSAATREQVRDRYATTCAQLEGRIRGTKQGHHHDIRSLPIERYLQIIRALVLNPEHLFSTEGGKPSATMMRDRAMTLLAAEGLRPGAIGNLTVDDFRYRAGDSKGYVVIKDNVARRGTLVTTGVPKAKGARSTRQNYNSNIAVKLWPWTCLAIHDYVEGERAGVLRRRLASRSKSFLFLAEHGGPIGDRTTIALVFSRLEKRLKTLGLLNTTDGDPYARGAHYEFSAYTLRHSAATLFYATNANKPEVKDLMRQRFGWTAASTSPDRYANRAMSEAANVDMMEFHEDLLQALAARRQQREAEPANEEQTEGNA
jgi:integrase